MTTWDIFVMIDGKQAGPFKRDQVEELVKQGTVRLEDLAWFEGQGDWEPLQKVLTLSVPALLQAAPVSHAAGAFPNITIDGGQVNPREFIEKGTALHLLGAWIVLIVGALILGLMTYGIGLIAALFLPVWNWFQSKKALALVRGTGIEVGPNQFPEIHKCAETLTRRLGMKETPHVFVVEDNTINAKAIKIGSRRVILLIDDAVDACLRSGDPQSLAFILAHEMAHHVLGHTRVIRATLGQYLKALSRLDEFTCDAVAARLVEDKTIAARGLAVLTVGPLLMPYLNFEQLRAQAREVAASKYSKKAERSLTHPLILRRLARFTA